MDLQTFYGERVSLLRFIPVNLRAGVRDGTGVVSLTTYLQNAINALNTGDRLVIPQGSYYLADSGSAQLCLINKEVHIESYGGKFILDPAIPNTTDIFKIKQTVPTSNGLRRLTFRGLESAAFSTAAGRHVLHFDYTASALSYCVFEHLHLGGVTGKSVYMNGSQAITGVVGTTGGGTSGLIKVTVPGHGLPNGKSILIAKVGGATVANSVNGVPWTITVIDANNFTLDGSTFSGPAYTSGGEAYAYDGFFLNTFKNCSFDCGVQGVRIGDSVSFFNPECNGDNIAFDITQVYGSKRLLIENANSGAQRGFLKLSNGSQARISVGNLESSAISASPEPAMIQIGLDSTERVDQCDINTFVTTYGRGASPGVTPDIHKGIVVDYADGTILRGEIAIGLGFGPSDEPGIHITSNAERTVVEQGISIEGFSPDRDYRLIQDDSGSTIYAGRTDPIPTADGLRDVTGVLAAKGFVGDHGGIGYYENQVPDSEGAGGWGASNITQTPATGTAPDGSATMVLLTESNDAGTPKDHSIGPVTLAVTSNAERWWFSLVAKASGRDEIYLGISDGSGQFVLASFDLVLAKMRILTVGPVGTGIDRNKIRFGCYPVHPGSGDGLVRCVLSVVSATFTSPISFVCGLLETPDTNPYAGDGRAAAYVGQVSVSKTFLSPYVKTGASRPGVTGAYGWYVGANGPVKQSLVDGNTSFTNELRGLSDFAVHGFDVTTAMTPSDTVTAFGDGFLYAAKVGIGGASTYPTDHDSYPVANGPLFGWAESGNTYQYCYQVFKPSSGAGFWFRYAINGSTWSDWYDAVFSQLEASGSVILNGATGKTIRYNATVGGPGTTGAAYPGTLYGGTGKVLGDPNAWVLVNISGTDYKMPLFL